MSVGLAPQQNRSRRSRERLLDAAERLLNDRHFEDISIAEIAADAGTSVGNFYARFVSKEALLGALHKRYEDDRARAWRAFLGDPALTALMLSGCIHAVTEKAIGIYRERRGVFRTLLTRIWRHPEKIEPQSRQVLGQLYDDVFQLIWRKRAEIPHENPERVIRVGLAAMLAAARENVVMRPRDLPGSLNLTDAELAQELSHMLHAYLTTPSPSRRDSRGG